MDNIKYIYISIPHTGYFDALSKSKEIIKKYFKDDNIVYINNPIDESNYNNKITLLISRLSLMQFADEIIFLENWENDDICKTEYYIASKFNLKIGFITLNKSLEINTLKNDSIGELVNTLKYIPNNYTLNFGNSNSINIGIDHDNGMVSLLTDEEIENISKEHSCIHYLKRNTKSG